MKLLTYLSTAGETLVGLDLGDRIIDVGRTDPDSPTTLREFLNLGERGLEMLRAISRRPGAIVADVARLLPPIPNPQKIVCVGLNYRDHAVEQGAAIPKEPVIFNKFVTTLVGPTDDVRLPAVSQAVDFEAELVLVVGKKAKHVKQGEGLNYLVGYMVGHDVSARDWQTQKDGKQWLLGKSFDNFAPTGPALFTKDEIANPHALGIELKLNGETMQKSNTDQLIFDADFLVSYISQVCTLLPGDLIFTGTPAGVGFARKPPVFLKPGDICEVSIDGLGTLRNRFIADDGAPVH